MKVSMGKAFQVKRIGESLGAAEPAVFKEQQELQVLSSER